MRSRTILILLAVGLILRASPVVSQSPAPPAQSPAPATPAPPPAAAPTPPTGAASAPAAAQTPVSPCCTFLQQAVNDISEIRVGMKRGDLERKFKITHANAFRNQSVYAYKRCPLIKVHVTFSYDPNVDSGTTSTDVITTMSELFLSQNPSD